MSEKVTDSIKFLMEEYKRLLIKQKEGKISKSYLSDAPTNCDAWFIPGLDTTNDPRSLISFRTIIEKLFSPEGCPWDQEQTPQSLIPFFLEETYELIDAMKKCINHNEQMIILHNRRGFSNICRCQDCGEIISCEHCSISLTYHSDSQLICHYCSSSYSFQKKIS